MSLREPLITGKCYHIVNKSIAGFIIFQKQKEYQRMESLIRYYQFAEMIRFSDYMKDRPEGWAPFQSEFQSLIEKKESLVRIIAYCLMPTHLHLVLQQLKDQGISIYMSNVLNGYSRYFNTKIRRKGPLWQNRFKSIAVESDEQLLHLTRYIHLNPVTAGFIEDPRDWNFSSYQEYIGQKCLGHRLCQFEHILLFRRRDYEQFVLNRKNDQRGLAHIKSILLEE